MLSRVANSLYWMGRYLERADNVARFIDVTSRLILDTGWENDSTQWEPLVRASGDDSDFIARYASFDEKNVVTFLTFDTDNPNAIISCVQQLRENARTVREIISSELWESINRLYHFVEKHSRKRQNEDLQAFFIAIHDANHQISGLIENTMSHGEGWHFLQMGRFLERADKTARMLDVKYFLLLPNPYDVDSPYDAVQWGAVLKSVSGFEMYCKQFHRTNYRDVTQFLVFDAQFPRAMKFCIHRVAASLQSITMLIGVDSPATASVKDLKDMLDKTDTSHILGEGLHEFVDRFQVGLNAIDDAIYKAFFELT